MTTSPQRRPLRLTVLLGVLALVGLAAASTRAERLAYAALQAGLGLAAFGAAWWLHGPEVSGRTSTWCAASGLRVGASSPSVMRTRRPVQPSS